jgi:hypothetical protein
MSALAESRVATSQVDNADLLKAAAIFLVAIDHFAIYFVETEPLDDWLQVVGRLAAPVFFFLVGFATSRTVPIRWLVLGCILTAFDAWVTTGTGDLAVFSSVLRSFGSCVLISEKVAFLIVVTYWPGLTLFMPRLLGMM